MLHPTCCLKWFLIGSLLDTSNFSRNSPDFLAAVKESWNQPIGYAMLQLLNLVLDILLCNCYKGA